MNRQSNCDTPARRNSWAVIALIVSMLTSLLISAPAGAAPPPPPSTFNAVVDFNNLKIFQETDTPNSSWNADEPTILVWRYQFELGDGNSADVEYLGRRTFNGRQARKAGGFNIADIAGRYTLPSLPADGNHAMGTLTLVLDSDGCSGATYNVIGNLVESGVKAGLNNFAADNPDVFSLATNPDPLASLTSALALNPTNAQTAVIVTDCLFNNWVVPSADLDDFIGLGVTLVLGVPANPLFCDAAEQFSGDQGTFTLLNAQASIFGINYSIQDEVGTNLTAAVDDTSFGWRFDDSDSPGDYRLLGTIEVNAPADHGTCPVAPPPPPPPPSSHFCIDLMLDWIEGNITEAEYLEAAQIHNCPV